MNFAPPPLSITTPLFCYISLPRFTYMKQFFCWQLILIFLYLTSAYFSLNVLLLHSSYCFPYFYRMKTVYSCWVWKLSNDACPLNLVPSGSFLTQSDWLDKKADQLLCIRKEALGTRFTPTKIMVWRYVINNA